MSVQDPEMIDFVSLDTEPSTALLVVSDHLDWNSGTDHQVVLQKKLNAYLAFIETKEIYERFPKALGKRIEIRVILKHAPDLRAEEFLVKVKAFIESAGLFFSVQVGLTNPPPNKVN